MREYNQGRYWFRSARLACVVIGLWTCFAFLTPLFAIPLNVFSAFRMPLGYVMAALGAPIAFLALAYMHARRQDAFDREEGVAEHL
jgi:putative solute:sodium symporter small subunit